MTTKTQWKLFIIWWSIGLIVSAYFLISAMLPTITPSEITQSNQESQDLQENAWTIDFAQMLIEWEAAKIVHVLIPDYIFEEGFNKIADQIKTERWFDVIFHRPEDITFIQNWGTQRIYNDIIMDIVLFPTDYVEQFIWQARSLELTNQIWPYYHPTFAAIMDRDFYTFIPHSIDPLVIYSKDNQTFPKDPETRLSIITSYTGAGRSHFPVLFWLTNHDRQLIERWVEPVENQLLIIYQMIHQLAEQDDRSNKIQTWRQIGNRTTTRHRNIGMFTQIINRGEQRFSQCRIYPSICVFVQWAWDHRFGFLSDAIKMKRYFNNPEDYHIHPFWNNRTYPARWRGFLINNNSTYTQSTLHFLEAYLQASLVNVEESLRNQHTIPASILALNTVSWTQTIPRQDINWSILISSPDFFNRFDQRTQFMKTWEWWQSVQDFIEKLDN